MSEPIRYKFFHRCKRDNRIITQNWDVPSERGPIIECQYCFDRVIAESWEQREHSMWHFANPDNLESLL
jgi:hypothetical protein